MMFDELRQACKAGGVGGFLPAMKQIANVASLPGIVYVSITNNTRCLVTRCVAKTSDYCLANCPHTTVDNSCPHRSFLMANYFLIQYPSLEIHWFTRCSFRIRFRDWQHGCFRCQRP